MPSLSPAPRHKRLLGAVFSKNAGAASPAGKAPGWEKIRTAAWFTPARARIYTRFLAAAMAIILLGMGLRLATTAATDRAGRPAVSDFVAFWAAGKIARSAPAADAYDQNLITAGESATVQLPAGTYLPYVYPPVFLPVCIALAALPYLPALLLFDLGGLLVFAVAVRRILPRTSPLLPCLAFPAAVMNAAIGQNGWISGCLLALAVPLLETRPFLAGVCVGGLAFKPHLGAALPFALIAARRWRVVAGAACSALTLTLASWAIFGTAAWRATLRAPAIEMAELATHPELRSKLASVYDALQLLGLPSGPALVVQAAVALAALAWLVAFARKRPGARLEMAAAIAVTLLCSPHLADYDLVCLGVPLAILFDQAQRTRFLPWEKTGLAVLYLMPLLARWSGVNLHVPLVPECVVLLVVLLEARRGRL